MLLSTKGRYAVRIMVRLAMADDMQPQRKQAIADAENLSANYVEQIMLRLRTAGLVRSHRGARGGFTLERSPGDITVGDILDVMEGPLTVAPCQESENKCVRAAECVMQPVWKAAGEKLQNYFHSINLEMLAGQAREQEANKAVSFSI